jgi:hypothetical protein
MCVSLDCFSSQLYSRRFPASTCQRLSFLPCMAPIFPASCRSQEGFLPCNWRCAAWQSKSRQGMQGGRGLPRRVRLPDCWVLAAMEHQVGDFDVPLWRAMQARPGRHPPCSASCLQHTQDNLAVLHSGSLAGRAWARCDQISLDLGDSPCSALPAAAQPQICSMACRKLSGQASSGAALQVSAELPATRLAWARLIMAQRGLAPPSSTAPHRRAR